MFLLIGTPWRRFDIFQEDYYISTEFIWSTIILRLTTFFGISIQLQSNYYLQAACLNSSGPLTVQFFCWSKKTKQCMWTSNAVGIHQLLMQCFNLRQPWLNSVEYMWRFGLSRSLLIPSLRYIVTCTKIRTRALGQYSELKLLFQHIHVI